MKYILTALMFAVLLYGTTAWAEQAVPNTTSIAMLSCPGGCKELNSLQPADKEKDKTKDETGTGEKKQPKPAPSGAQPNLPRVEDLPEPRETSVYAYTQNRILLGPVVF